MKRFFYLSVFSTIMLFSLSSCLGDQGNMTSSYGTGSILYLHNTPCVRLDNINLCLTGNGIPALKDSVARAMVSYTIDWDNQPATANTNNIYDATFATVNTWPITEMLSRDENYKFSDTDTMRTLAQPFITYATKQTPNMLTVNVRLYASEGNVQLIQKNKPEDEYYSTAITDTLILSYEADATSANTRDCWYTFELPDYPKNVTSITLLFKSVERAGFSAVYKPDLGGYIYTTSTKFPEKQ